MIQAIRCMLGMHTWDKAILDPHVPDAGWFCEHCSELDWLADAYMRLGYLDAIEPDDMALPCTCYAQRGELAWEDTRLVDSIVEYANERRMPDYELCFHDMRRAGVEYALLA